MPTKLEPATQKIVENCINEVINDYVKESKYFTADSLHYIRSNITKLIHERLGEEFVMRVDVGIDLNKVGDIPFFFKIDVPKQEDTKK